MTGLSPFADSQDERGHGARSARAMPFGRAMSLRTSVVPVIIIALPCVAAAIFALADRPSAETVRITLGALAGGVLLMLVAVFLAAGHASRRVAAEVMAVRVLAQRGQARDNPRPSSTHRHNHPNTNPDAAWELSWLPAPGRSG